MFFLFKKLEGHPWSEKVIETTDTHAGRVITQPETLSWHPNQFTEELKLGLWRPVSKKRAAKFQKIVPELLRQTIFSFRDAQSRER